MQVNTSRLLGRLLMLEKFFTWGYLKFVFWPSVQRAIDNDEDAILDLEIEFTPDQELSDIVAAKDATKH